MMRKLLVLATIIALPLSNGSAQNTPGKYKEWNKVDSVEVAQSFKIADYDKVALIPLDRSLIKLPADSDNAYGPAKTVLENSDTYVLEGLKKGINDARKGAVVEMGTEGDKSARTLLVRGKLIALNPGSRAARAFAGFGAGAASAKVYIELVDAASGNVLARMTHERRAGTGGFGGSYEKTMSESLREVGETFAKGFKGFQ
ncbi:MAG: DUF4410 domain-containing protein [Gemmatimonas sp.]